MTLDEIRASDKPVLTPDDISEVLGCNAQSIRIAAREHPERLGFHVSVVGRKTMIPRKAFLRYMGEVK